MRVRNSIVALSDSPRFYSTTQPVPAIPQALCNALCPLTFSLSSYTKHLPSFFFPFQVSHYRRETCSKLSAMHRIVPFVQVVTARLGIPTLILRFIICYLFVITIVSLWQAVDPTSAHNTNEMVDYGAEVMQDYLVRTSLLPFSNTSTSLQS